MATMDSSYLQDGLHEMAGPTMGHNSGTCCQCRSLGGASPIFGDPIAEFVQVKVPSCIQLERNDRADCLAELGCLAPPLVLGREAPCAGAGDACLLTPAPARGVCSATPKIAVEPVPLVASDEIHTDYFTTVWSEHNLGRLGLPSHLEMNTSSIVGRILPCRSGV